MGSYSSSSYSAPFEDMTPTDEQADFVYTVLGVAFSHELMSKGRGAGKATALRAAARYLTTAADMPHEDFQRLLKDRNP